VVAFPALGTNDLCYPADVAAEIMINAVAEYISENLTSTCIKTVRMVIYTDSDYQQFCHTLSKFNKSCTIQSSATNATAVSAVTMATPAISPTVSHPKPNTTSNRHPIVVESQTVGNITVEIIVGDITEDDSDAIVNPTNDRMDLTSSAVSNAILNKAGPDLQKKCDSITSQGYRLHPDKACCTRAVGNLKCKNVFHILVCGTDIAKAVSVCLEEAETSRLSSIAFPGIGTGSSGHNLASAAQSMCKSIVTFVQKHPIYVNQIRVIIFQQSMILSYIDHLSLSQVQAEEDNDELQTPRKQQNMQAIAPLELHQNYIDHAINMVPLIFRKPSIFLKQKSPGPSSSCSTNSATTKPIAKGSVLVLQVFSDDINKVQKTEKRLKQLIEDQLSTVEIDNELINQLSRKEHVDIKNRAKIRNVELKINTGRFQHNILLRGDKEDIPEVKKEIDKILKEKHIKDSKKKEIQSVNAKVQWQWSNKSGVYEDYDINANYAIEQAYQANIFKRFVYKNQQSVTKDVIKDNVLDFNIPSEEFDFLQMKATDSNDPSVMYDIKRNIDRKLLHLYVHVYMCCSITVTVSYSIAILHYS